MKNRTETAEEHVDKPEDAKLGNDGWGAKQDTDPTVGHAKPVAGNAVRPIKESVHNIMDKARLLAQRAVHKARRMC